MTNTIETISDPDAPEQWRNESRSTSGILRFDPTAKGGRVKELIAGGRTFDITTAERRLTERSIREERHNPFRNGKFVPLVLHEGAEDYEQLVADPNLVSAESIAELSKGPIGAMEKKVAQLDKLTVLRRILEVANQEGWATKRLDVLRARIAEVERSDRGPAGPGRPGDPVFSADLDKRESYYPPEGDTRGELAGTGRPGDARAPKTATVG